MIRRLIASSRQSIWFLVTPCMEAILRTPQPGPACCFTLLLYQNTNRKKSTAVYYCIKISEQKKSLILVATMPRSSPINIEYSTIIYEFFVYYDKVGLFFFARRRVLALRRPGRLRPPYVSLDRESSLTPAPEVSSPVTRGAVTKKRKHAISFTGCPVPHCRAPSKKRKTL